MKPSYVLFIAPLSALPLLFDCFFFLFDLLAPSITTSSSAFLHLWPFALPFFETDLSLLEDPRETKSVLRLPLMAFRSETF